MPAAERRWLNRLRLLRHRWDGIHRLRSRTAELAGIEPGQRVLDVGCGAGELCLQILTQHPDAKMTGLDPDADALRRAARRAGRWMLRRRLGRSGNPAPVRSLPLQLVVGFADRLPCEPASFDHVVSSFAVHHLPAEQQQRFAREALRVLSPGGRITLADMAGHGHSGEHHLDSDRPAKQHGDGGLVQLLTEAGFLHAAVIEEASHRVGRIVYVQASAPGLGEQRLAGA